MEAYPKPPDTFIEFTQQFPKLAEAWRLATEAGSAGPLDDRTIRLVKLAVSIGNMREGAVHSAVRKALASGITRAEIDQVIALAATTLGFPSAVAVFSWVRDELKQTGKPDEPPGSSIRLPRSGSSPG